MSKKADFIFVGPQAAGKTTLFQALQGNSAPEEYVATSSNGEPKTIHTSLKPKFFGWIRGKITVIDAGGKQSEFDHYEEWCQNAERIIIVFDGIKLLEEVRNCENGGETTSFCKMIVSKLHEIDASNIFFVATHADEHPGGEEGMLREIENSIDQANAGYTALFNSKRYPQFKDMFGRLSVVNAKNQASVLDAFKSRIMSQEQ